MVFRIEMRGEEPIPFPTLQDAMREDPASIEAVIVTSVRGVTLAETTTPLRGSSLYFWRATVAGLDVLEGGVRGLRAAS